MMVLNGGGATTTNCMSLTLSSLNFSSRCAKPIIHLNGRKYPNFPSSIWKVNVKHRIGNFPAINAIGLLAAAVVLSTPSPAEDETLSNVPPVLSGDIKDSKFDSKKRIQRPKSRNAESCTVKCVTTCIRGGGGSPGEGPLNVRRPIVVFKQGFRSRQYCLVECSDICNLLEDLEKSP